MKKYPFLEKHGDRIVRGGLVVFILSALIAFTLLCSLKYPTYDVKASTGEVNTIEGLYIFTDAKPVKETEYLGSVKIGFAVSGSYQEIINKLAKKVRKEYPAAQALIFDGNDKAQAVKFK